MRSGRTRAFRAAAACAAAWIAGAGCVERTLQIRSEPPGALVYLNGEEAGRTPMRKTFVWYGTYDVQIRKEGYATRTAKTKVWAPWWQIPPIDLIAEILPLPLRDNHAVAYRLDPLTAEQTDPAALIERAAEMRGRLQSSKNTRGPRTADTQPTTKSAD